MRRNGQKIAFPNWAQSVRGGYWDLDSELVGFSDLRVLSNGATRCACLVHTWNHWTSVDIFNVAKGRRGSGSAHVGLEVGRSFQMTSCLWSALEGNETSRRFKVWHSQHWNLNQWRNKKWKHKRREHVAMFHFRVLFHYRICRIDCKISLMNSKTGCNFDSIAARSRHFTIALYFRIFASEAWKNQEKETQKERTQERKKQGATRGGEVDEPSGRLTRRVSSREK